MSEGIYPWQKKQWSQVHRLISQDRLPHALLVSGMRGLGKLAFIQHLIQAALCESPVEDSQPCNSCRSCALFKADTHPDFMRIHPESSDQKIRIDRVRDLIDFLAFSPSLGRRRIVLVGVADALNAFSANSLLKTLEEPTSSALILLASDRPQSLPATIRSRCQSLHFVVPPMSESIHWLQTKLTDVRRAELALIRAAGAPLAALNIASDVSFSQRQTLIDCLIQLTDDKLDPGTLVDTHQDLMGHEMLDILSAWLRDLIRIGKKLAVRENPDYENELLAQRKKLDLPKLFDCLDQTRLLGDWMGKGLNTSLQFEALLIRYRVAVNKQT